MNDQTNTQTTRKHSLPVAAVLALADLLISLMLMTRRNERTVQPTRRTVLPDHVKRGLAQIQKHKCMFCGVRRKLDNLQVDHVHPVVRGGSNQTANLQLLCSTCNQRKGIQTNEEFYTRYQRTLRGVTPGVPPKAPIPQARFRDETKRTRAHDEVRKFKKTRYISPTTKIRSGSLITGATLGVAWFLAWNLSFTAPGDLISDISVFGGIASGLLTAAGLMVRAKVTGRYEQT